VNFFGGWLEVDLLLLLLGFLKGVGQKCRVFLWSIRGEFVVNWWWIVVI
jgi:hypothetical protein